MLYDVVKYKATRTGLFSTIWAIVKHSKYNTVAVPIGELDISLSKRIIKATSEFAGEIGIFSNCTNAKENIIKEFEKQQELLRNEIRKETEKEIEKKVEKSIDSIKDMIYNKEVVNNTNKNSKESIDMKTNKNTKTTKTSEAVKLVGKIESFSKTREQKETMKITMQNTYATVLSGSGETYIVTKESCTCPDHFYRGFDKKDDSGNIVKVGVVCRHRTAVADIIKKMKNDVKYW